MIDVKQSYSIQEVAKMLLVDTTTIRNWEKNSTIDLVEKYTKNGYRYFDIKDVIKIAKSKNIKRLMIQ